jgi:hypothetical protein
MAATGAPENTVRCWVQRNKIPDEHWKRFGDLDYATLDELAAYAAAKKAA